MLDDSGPTMRRMFEVEWMLSCYIQTMFNIARGFIVYFS